MRFLKQPDGDEKKISFITSSEQSGFLHLYQHSLRLEQENFVQFSEGVLKPINSQHNQLTDGDWPIMHDEAVSIDEKNHLIYFVGFRDPLESHL